MNTNAATSECCCLERPGRHLHNWIFRRTQEIRKGASPHDIDQNKPKLVVHVATAGFSKSKYPLSYQKASGVGQILHMLEPGWTPETRWNVDGPFKYEQRAGYVQVFRSGVIEAVDMSAVEPINEQNAISAGNIETILFNAAQSYVRVLDRLGASYPMTLSVQLLGVKGFRQAGTQKMRRVSGRLIDRQDLDSLPEIEIPELEDNIPKLLRPLFDSIWNAFGYHQSLNFDEHNDWIPIG